MHAKIPYAPPHQRRTVSSVTYEALETIKHVIVLQMRSNLNEATDTIAALKTQIQTCVNAIDETVQWGYKQRDVLYSAYRDLREQFCSVDSHQPPTENTPEHQGSFVAIEEDYQDAFSVSYTSTKLCLEILVRYVKCIYTV